jgi:hypothetical protein
VSYPKLDGFNIQAVRSLKHRVPKDTHPELAKLADYALMRIVAAMDEQIPEEHAGIVLKAATLIRDEICGPIVKKVEVKMGLAQMLAQAALEDDEDVVEALSAEPELDLPLLPDLETRKAPDPAEAEPGAETRRTPTRRPGRPA